MRSIQYLRGIAAFAVLVFHAAERAGGHFGVGAAGVDVFFVISGFIMWVVTCRKTPSPGDFLMRRVQRIVPLYWAATLLVVGVALAIPGSFPNLQVSFEALLKSLFFVPYHDAGGLIAPLIVPGWTLNYEMFFYLLFAGGLFGAGAPAGLDRHGGARAAGGDPAVAGCREPADRHLHRPDPPGIRRGRVAGQAVVREPAAERAHRMAAGGARIGGFRRGDAGRDRRRERPGPLVGAPALLLVAGAVTVERHGRVPDLWPLRVVGDASYSLYLFHGLAISATVRMLGALGLASPALVFATSLVAGVVAGVVVYHLAEKPMMRLFRTGLGAHRPSGVAAAPSS
ncbi:acyltransferase [Phenylobacterium sp. J426]|uniref:acyltransferase family protein n=1 Tax=Phenylobacterium sp. J426 TaxID=2898439 RepID=UPI0021513B19|nr:acyltransferase [Phenylobacterium sp. J426]MCR5875270.1 acyltransferase [Phenylobacterium sp. J426]